MHARVCICSVAYQPNFPAHPQLSEDAREVCLQIKKAFSQARYISRIYGTIDSVDGLLHNLPR